MPSATASASTPPASRRRSGPRRPASGRGRAPERLLGTVRQPSVVPEQHPFDERAPFSRQPGRGRAPKPPSQAVCDPAEPTTPPDDVPFVHVQDDVHALPTEPRLLVEAVIRSVRRLHHRQHAQAGALRRRAAERKPSSTRSPRVRAIWRRSNAPARASAVVTASEPPGGPDPRRQNASVEQVEPVLPHHQAPASVNAARSATAPSRRREHRRTEDASNGDQGRVVHANRVARREPNRAGGNDRVCRQDGLHGTTSPRRSAMRAGPMPGIASSWSTEWTDPRCVR